MPLDIYTKQSIATMSEEHIVPRSLGGKLTSLKLIDKTTNDLFGHGIDSQLDEALRVARVIIDARSSDGEPPRALTGVEGEDGQSYRIDAGGVTAIKPRGSARRGATGELILEARVSDARDLRRMLRNIARKSGKNVDELVKSAMAVATTTVSAIPAMSFGLSLWQDGPYRATAKAACNLLAHTAPELFLESQFDEIRQYVLFGAPVVEPPVQAVAVELGDDGLGPLDHLVKVEVTPTGEVVALVVYFRLLAFVVRLGQLRSRRSLRISYRIDQLARVHRVNHEKDLAIVVPSFQEAVQATHDEFTEVVKAQVTNLIPRLLEVQEALWIQRIVAPLLKKYSDEVGDQVPTDKQRSAFVGKLTMRIVEELAPRVAQASARRRELERGAAEAPDGDSDES